MDNTRRQSVIPIRAQLASVEVVGDLGEKNSTKRADHFVIIYLDDKEVAKSEKKSRQPAPRWEWPEDYQLLFHPSSAIKIVIYRKSKNLIEKHVVGQFERKVIELLDNDAIVDLQDKTGAEIASKSKIKMKLSLVPETENTFKSFMKTVDDDISRMKSAVTTTTGTIALGALGRALQLTKSIMDLVAGTHPILQASWTVMSAVYTAVQQAALLDDTVRALAEALRETLGIAKEYPDLLVIEGTTDVIEEIGRTSLKVASFIHEYTRLAFMARTAKFQLSDDMKTRIAECQKSCEDLKQKFNTRVLIDTNQQLKIVKDSLLSEKIYRWLSAPDSSRNYNEACEKHQEDTCSWFLDGERFREFQEKAEFLWIKGKAGCGKTILCSTIIDKIQKLRNENPATTCAYFFFDGRDSQEDLQRHDKLIRSLILQLSLQCDGIPTALVDLYGHGYHHPSTNSLEEVLYHIIDGMHSTYIIIDSLDECTERKKSLQWIKQLISRQIATLHLAVISRPEPDIEDVLQSLDAHCVDWAEDSTNHDIALYLDHELSVLETPWDEETQEVVKSTLTKKADGMFRWVVLQLMELQTCSSPAAVMTQLKALPKGLYETYSRILLKGDEKDRPDTTTLLRWLCFSVRPMDLSEIAETVAVRFDDESGPYFSTSHRYYDEKHILKKCSGLIVESEGKIKLAHFSIKEYLLSDQLRESVGAISTFHLTSIETSHSLISQTCLAYLLQFNAPGSVDSNTAVSFPLAHYAAEHWVSHAHSGGIDTLDSEPSHTLVLAKKLLTTDSATLTNWVRIWNCDCPSDFPFSREERLRDLDQITLPPALYYTSMMGLHRLSLDLSREVDINAQGGNYGTALQAASYGGHEAIVRLLVEKGADVNAQGGEYGNALQAASSMGNEANVELLLKNGADVNTQGGSYNNALQAASQEGKDTIVELLLKHGANVNAQGGGYGNALQAASQAGLEATVELLLKNGADVNAQGGKHGTALQAASCEGGHAVVQLLLKHGADVHAQGGDYGSALNAAACVGEDAVVELLLKNGADVNAQGGNYGTALHAASWGGEDAVVELLLKNGADVNAQGGEYGTALQAASCKGNEAIVELLLKNGADVNAQGGKYGNALHAASWAGKEEDVDRQLKIGTEVQARPQEAEIRAAVEAIIVVLIKQQLNEADPNLPDKCYSDALQMVSDNRRDAVVELLLKNGADANAQGGRYGNVLTVASFQGKDAIIELLLKNGADVNAQGGDYGNALQAASWAGVDATVELLLKNGADVNAQGGEYGTALQAAAYEGEDAVVELLLKNGADVNAQGGEYGNALQAASYSGKGAVVELLLKNGADVNAHGGNYGNALQAASCDGKEATVELLLKNGADVNAQGGFYGNALQAASWPGNDAAVELLLKNGADVNAQGGRYGSALVAASCEGKEATVELLLKNGADVNAQGGQYGNALAAASWAGEDATVELLLKNGAEVNAQGGFYGNALQAASWPGNDAAVELLLKNGADVNAQGGEYGSALVAASCEGKEATVELLLKNGADVNAQGGKFGNALQAAITRGHDSIVKLLLANGAETIST